MKNGVPFDRVYDCDFFSDYERMAMSIMFSEFEVNEFDWKTMRFIEKEQG